MGDFTESDRQALNRFLGKTVDTPQTPTVSTTSANPAGQSSAETQAFIDNLVAQGQSMDEALTALRQRLQQAGQLRRIQDSLPTPTRRLLDRADVIIANLGGRIRAQESRTRPGQQDKTRRQG